MSTFFKLLAVLIMVNIIAYAGVNFVKSASGEAIAENTFSFEGDLIELLLESSLDSVVQNTKDNFTSYGVNFTSTEFTTFPEEFGGEGNVETAGISFIDVVKMIIPFFKMLFNIAVSPITLFVSFRMPVVFVILIGLPWTILMIVTVMYALRGVGD